MASIGGIRTVLNKNKEIRDEHNNYFNTLSYDMTKLYEVDVNTNKSNILNPLQTEIDNLISQIKDNIRKARDFRSDFSDEIDDLVRANLSLNHINMSDILLKIQKVSEEVFNEKKLEYSDTDKSLDDLIKEIESDIRSYNNYQDKIRDLDNRIKIASGTEQYAYIQTKNSHEATCNRILRNLDEKNRRLVGLNNRNEQLINKYFKK